MSFSTTYRRPYISTLFCKSQYPIFESEKSVSRRVFRCGVGNPNCRTAGAAHPLNKQETVSKRDSLLFILFYMMAGPNDFEGFGEPPPHRKKRIPAAEIARYAIRRLLRTRPILPQRIFQRFPLSCCGEKTLISIPLTTTEGSSHGSRGSAPGCLPPTSKPLLPGRRFAGWRAPTNRGRSAPPEKAAPIPNRLRW